MKPGRPLPRRSRPEGCGNGGRLRSPDRSSWSSAADVPGCSECRTYVTKWSAASVPRLLARAMSSPMACAGAVHLLVGLQLGETGEASSGGDQKPRRGRGGVCCAQMRADEHLHLERVNSLVPRPGHFIGNLLAHINQPLGMHRAYRAMNECAMPASAAPAPKLTSSDRSGPVTSTHRYCLTRHCRHAHFSVDFRMVCQANWCRLVSG